MSRSQEEFKICTVSFLHIKQYFSDVCTYKTGNITQHRGIIGTLRKDDFDITDHADYYQNSPSYLALDSAFLYIFIAGIRAAAGDSAAVTTLTGRLSR
jgi:hypothetical protein